jgi:Ni,Fe-hydrogenase III small subunit
MIPILLKVLRTGFVGEEAPGTREDWRTRAPQVQAEILGMLGRALVIRQVDAGSCNGCELELHALNNPYYNIEGLGIRFAASPRHADMLLVTGPVTRHMEQALRIAYEAMPDPKLVVAVGDCGCNGGIFGEGYATVGGVAKVIPVDVTVPGCPPPPLAVLQGILTAISNVIPAPDKGARGQAPAEIQENG